MKAFSDQYIIITGGAGFIGSGVVRYLNDRGISNLILVDDLGASEKWKNLVGKCFIDILDKSQLLTWMVGREDAIKAFIHLGACSSTLERNASYLLENNYRYSVKLAEYAFTHGQRFIYASSAATYGDGTQGFLDNENQLESLQPLNMYGYSKHLFDLWLKNQRVLNKVVGLKYFNVFGPNENHKGQMASAIVRMLPAAQHENVVRLFKSSEPSKYPDGGQKRDFVYIKDVARMTCAFLFNKVNGIYNIGSGNASTWNDLASSVFKAIHKPVKIDYVNMPDELIGKYQNYTCADMTKTRHALQEQATSLPLEAAVEDYICNYLLPGKTW